MFKEDEEKKFAYLVKVLYCKSEFHDENAENKVVEKQLIVYAADSYDAKNKVQEHFDSKLTEVEYYSDFEIEVCETLY